MDIDSCSLIQKSKNLCDNAYRTCFRNCEFKEGKFVKEQCKQNCLEECNSCQNRSTKKTIPSKVNEIFQMATINNYELVNNMINNIIT